MYGRSSRCGVSRPKPILCFIGLEEVELGFSVIVEVARGELLEDFVVNDVQLSVVRVDVSSEFLEVLLVKK